jgi:bacteriocin resistance YdeI/OmpD-like protein
MLHASSSGQQFAGKKQAPWADTLARVSSQRVPGGVVHKLPSDLRKALSANPAALEAWKDITPLARNEFICWVEDAKQKMTRERRIRRTQEELEEGSFGPAAGRDADTASAPADSGRHAPWTRVRGFRRLPWGALMPSAQPPPTVRGAHVCGHIGRAEIACDAV